MGQRWDVVIVGAGMAGLSTAIWARRLGLTALVLDQSGQPGGQLTAIAGRIADYPGLDLPDGRALSLRLASQATEAGAELALGRPVLAIDAATLTCSTPAGPVTGDSLVLAMGISARHLGVPGEETLYQHRLIRRPSHDLGWFAGRRVAVIGGGDRAAENALLLAPVAAQVHLIHRGEALRARPTFADPVASDPRITLHLRTQVTAFERVAGGTVLRLAQAGRSGQLSVEAVCIYIGNQPNSQLVRGQVELTPAGYLVTDRTGQTALPGLYAVGDLCTPPQFQSLATAAGQAMVVAKQIALQKGAAAE